MIFCIISFAAKFGGHHPGGCTLMKVDNFCGWIYKEHWTNDYLEGGGGWEWWRWQKQ